ncbi:hypothetical protein HQ36_08850 [Porphyromonas gingivicanis]|uniref:Uncharacterized protein n=1 Tax=Porphyromonas gingivicanis TaxID=266762 RepID=A0A0A2G9F8_9PORP|nr:hypothetical protein HQ36_08850 [Porphyromonas gingivicanis]
MLYLSAIELSDFYTYFFGHYLGKEADLLFTIVMTIEAFAHGANIFARNSSRIKFMEEQGAFAFLMGEDAQNQGLEMP